MQYLSLPTVKPIFSIWPLFHRIRPPKAQKSAESAAEGTLKSLIRTAAHDDAVLFVATPNMTRNKMVLEVSPAFVDYVTFKSQLNMIDDLRLILDELERTLTDRALR